MVHAPMRIIRKNFAIIFLTETLGVIHHNIAAKPRMTAKGKIGQKKCKYRKNSEIWETAAL